MAMRLMETAWPIGVERQGGLITTNNPGGYDGETGLACPVCGEVYMHIEAIEQSSTDHDGWTRIVFWSECGHRVTSTLNEHKGALFVTTKREDDYYGRR